MKIKCTLLTFIFIILGSLILSGSASGEDIGNSDDKSRNEIALQKILKLNNAEKEKIRFVILGDSRTDIPKFTEIVELINKLDPDFVIHLGDIVTKGLENEYDEVMPVFDRINPPLFAVAGNHDRPKGKNSFANFKKYFGDCEITFDLLNLRFILVDNSLGYLRKNQIDRIEKDLVSDRTRFLMMHAPPEGPYKNHVFEGGASQLVELIEKSECEYAIFSHIHGYNHRMIGNKCNAYITGGGGAELNGWDEAEEIYHVLLVTLTGKDVKIEMVPLEE